MNITKYNSTGDLYWVGCYENIKDWRKFVTPSSYAHPAKMSPKLCDRIFRHLQSLGFIKEGTTVVDFMAGIGTTGIIASKYGCDFVGVELEQHFVDMIEGFDCDGVSMSDKTFFVFDCGNESESYVSHDKHVFRRGCLEAPYFVDVECSGVPKEVTRKVFRCGEKNAHECHHVAGNKDKCEEALHHKINWMTIKGDSRRLSELLNKEGIGVISPPYENIDVGYGIRENRWDKIKDKEGFKGRKKWETGTPSEYSDDPENIGNLKDTIGLISPPYGDIRIGDYKNKREEFVKWIKNELETKGYIEWQGKKYNEKEWRDMNYGCIDGRVMVGSPKMGTEGYNLDNPSNIGNLSDKIVITSPPYFQQGSNPNPNDTTININGRDYARNIYYNGNKDNIGNVEKENYLSAMLQVYQEAFKCGLSPLVVVTKNPTRNGALRRLDLDTITLLEKSGYEIFDYHRAMLFTEHQQNTLTGASRKQVTGRLSFFKRNSYRKGNIVANFEDVIFALIPKIN